jgi:hypothetical protein
MDSMTGRPCTICSNTDKMRIAGEMILAGAPDQAIADRLCVGRMSVARHRASHVLAPAQALADAAGKGRDMAEQRAQMMAAAEAGDPSAFVALAGIVADLKKVHERLERTAEAAEQDGQRMAVAGLSAQQIRASEVRAKIGGVGGYGAREAAGQNAGVPFSVTINFSGGRTETISTTLASKAVQTIEGEADGMGDDGANIAPEWPVVPLNATLAAKFGGGRDKP